MNGSDDGHSWTTIDTVRGHVWPEHNPGQGNFIRHLAMGFKVHTLTGSLALTRRLN